MRNARGQTAAVYRDGPGRSDPCANICSHFCGNSSAPMRIVTTGVPVVTMRSIPVFTRVLAQFSKFQAPSDLSDGLKTGAFDVPRRPVPDCLSTNARSGALPFHWTTIKMMIQCCEASIVSSSPTDETVWNLTRHPPVT